MKQLNDNPNSKKTASSHRLSRRELRASFLLPIGLTLLIWIVGVVIYASVPAEFNTAVALVIGIGLLVFLIYWTRNARTTLRITAVLLAIPALAGIAFSLVDGRLQPTFIGISITILGLILQRALSTPISYRVATRYFNRGDLPQALKLINKSLEARPNFWESYQLRALIYLAQMDFVQAERNALQAIKRQPKAHPIYNTLGQIYLAQMSFDQARDAYASALDLAPKLTLYQYHLGLSYYRLEQYARAVEHLAAATRGTMPMIEYDLLAHYYLGMSLEQIGETEVAQQAYEGMYPFRDGLYTLQSQIENQPDYPHITLMRTDLAAIAQCLAKE